MRLNLTPHHADVTYYVAFKEPFFKIIIPEQRVKFFKAIIGKFGIRMNDFVVNDKLPSNDFFHFSKLFGQTFVDVGLGIEETTIKINRPDNQNQLVDIMMFFQQLFEGQEFTIQRILIQRHFESADDVNGYLSMFNPNLPELFKDKLVGQGYAYSLMNSEHQLIIHIFVTKSVVVANGLFFSTDFVFSPSIFNIENAILVAKKQYDLVLEGLSLKISEE
jgi:hypothetical protein